MSRKTSSTGPPPHRQPSPKHPTLIERATAPPPTARQSHHPGRLRPRPEHRGAARPRPGVSRIRAGRSSWPSGDPPAPGGVAGGPARARSALPRTARAAVVSHPQHLERIVILPPGFRFRRPRPLLADTCGLRAPPFQGAWASRPQTGHGGPQPADAGGTQALSGTAPSLPVYHYPPLGAVSPKLGLGPGEGGSRQPGSRSTESSSTKRLTTDLLTCSIPANLSNMEGPAMKSSTGRWVSGDNFLDRRPGRRAPESRIIEG